MQVRGGFTPLYRHLVTLFRIGIFEGQVLLDIWGHLWGRLIMAGHLPWVRAPLIRGGVEGGVSVSPKVPSPKVPKTRPDLRKHTETRVSPKVRHAGTYGDTGRHLGTKSLYLLWALEPEDIWGH